MQIIYEDQRILVVIKPSGVLSTDEPGGMPEQLRKYLGSETACVRSVHRLDQPVSGVMVYARSRMAASILSEQIRNHSFHKTYLAVVHGVPEQPSGELTDYLARNPETHRTIVTDGPGKDARPAKLEYQLLGTLEGRSLLKIRLHTGRTHQIRVQLSSRGLPIVGDQKYGNPEDRCQIALWSHELRFQHPQTGEDVKFTVQPPETDPWIVFRDKLNGTDSHQEERHQAIPL